MLRIIAAAGVRADAAIRYIILAYLPVARWAPIRVVKVEEISGDIIAALTWAWDSETDLYDQCEYAKAAPTPFEAL